MSVLELNHFEKHFDYWTKEISDVWTKGSASFDYMFKLAKQISEIVSIKFKSRAEVNYVKAMNVLDDSGLMYKSTLDGEVFLYESSENLIVSDFVKAACMYIERVSVAINTYKVIKIADLANEVMDFGTVLTRETDTLMLYIKAIFYSRGSVKNLLDTLVKAADTLGEINNRFPRMDQLSARKQTALSNLMMLYNKNDKIISYAKQAQPILDTLNEYIQFFEFQVQVKEGYFKLPNHWADNIEVTMQRAYKINFSPSKLIK